MYYENERMGKEEFMDACDEIITDVLAQLKDEGVSDRLRAEVLYDFSTMMFGLVDTRTILDLYRDKVQEECGEEREAELFDMANDTHRSLKEQEEEKLNKPLEKYGNVAFFPGFEPED